MSSSLLPAAQPELAEILAPVEAELKVVEKWLCTDLISENALVEDMLKQIFLAGGKRLRPAITLLASKMTAKDPENLSRLHIILAVLTELIHTASLVHDDVLDEAALRRGKETVNRRWNDKLAVLLGDLLFAQASICLARIMNPSVVGVYGQVLGDLCAGEIRQMQKQFSTAVDWDVYIAKSVGKTASLFAAGAHCGAILNACPDSSIAFLKSYGLNLGILFQIIDDLLDVTGNTTELGKRAGSDLQSGILTAPALFVLEAKDKPAQRLNALITTRAVAGDEGLAEALSIIRDCGGVEKTVELAQKYGRQAREALSSLPVSNQRLSEECRHSLAAFVDYMLVRTK